VSHAASDCNLLFGILALQMDFIGQDDLIAAMNAWVLDKTKPLGQILREQGKLAEDEHTLLDGLVRKHLEKHSNDPQRSLAAVSSTASIRQDLQQIADADVQASLAHVPGTRIDPEGTALYEHPASSTPGPRFRIVRPYAKGGLGEVFVARDEELQREVALKEIQQRHAQNPESRARFLLEAEVTGGLEHPGIVPVYGLGTYADGRPFYAMRFIRGDSLKEAIERFHREQETLPAGERTLRLRQLLGRFVDVCNAVAYAHSRGVLHRDLKPGNIMLGNYGETLVVDWGLAKIVDKADTRSAEGPLRPTLSGDSTKTQIGVAIGTPAYMSPEQAAGRLDQLGPASDVYSLGATLYTLLTGRAPFAEGSLGAMLDKVQKGNFPPPRQVQRQVPPPLEAICLRAMALAPQDRYATPRELAEEIEHWLADEPVRAHREPWTARAGRWVRRHQPLTVGVGVLLLTGLAALAISTILIGGALRKEEQARKARALSQVNALLDANPRAVPAILDGLEEVRGDVLPRLEEVWHQEDNPQTHGHRLRAALALLPAQPEMVKGALFEWLIQIDDPAEMLLVRDRLLPYREELRPQLWQRVEDPATRPEARFRALVALAAFDAGNERWKERGEAVLEQLLTADPLYLGTWTEALRPVREVLLPPLIEVFRGRKLAEEKQVAATLLADYAADRPALLAELALDANARQHATLLPRLKALTDTARLLLLAELEKKPAEKATDAEKDRLAFRQANAAVTLLHLGEPEPAWPLLRHSPDPSRRTYLTQHLGPYGIDVAVLLERLHMETDVSARRALLLSLGEYPPGQTPPARRQELVSGFVQDYRDDPDPGIHGAIEWLLRQWHEDGKLPRLRNHKPKDPPRGKSTWSVNGQEQTLTVIPGPVEFLMGSPESEPDRTENEVRHRRKIPRSFALGTKEVTVAEFRRFLEANPEVQKRFDDKGQAREFLKRFSPEESCPIIVVDWYMATEYCNWLSQQEGLPEKEWCYAKDTGKTAEGIMVTQQGYLARKGYRLPTEAEWEYGCRAGAVTSRPYGRSEALLGKYDWYQGNAGERSHPVGSLRPNDLGLFDVLGNAGEWCQDHLGRYPVGGPGEPAIDDEEKNRSEQNNRVIRGAGFGNLVLSARSADREAAPPETRMSATGLRVARTID
jgi:formylglycine-generating enzyme required for sulfatase activity